MTIKRRPVSGGYNPEAAEPDFTREDFVDGVLVCECCEETIPGGETYFSIPGEGNFCESCARDRFSRIAPYLSEVYDEDALTYD